MNEEPDSMELKQAAISKNEEAHFIHEILINIMNF